MNVKEWILPQDKSFFDQIEAISRNVLVASNELYELLINYENVGDKRKKIKDIEHTGDEMIHDMFTRLGKTFITPLDRADLRRLVSALDDIVDHIYAISNRLQLYEIKKPTQEMIDFTELLVRLVGTLHDAVKALKQKRDWDLIKERCVEANRLENMGDEILNNAVAKLFKENDPVEIMKLKEIYEYFEQATDKCEDVADVIRDIVMEYA